MWLAQRDIGARRRVFLIIGFHVDHLRGITVAPRPNEWQGRQPGFGRGAKCSAGEGSELAFDLEPLGFFVDLAADEVVDAAEQIDDFGFGEGFGVAFGEAARVGAFEQPGGGPPVAAGTVVEHIHGRDLGGDECLANLLVKLGVAAGLATDGFDAAAGVASGGLEGTAAGEHGDDFVFFGFGEESWSGHGSAVGERGWGMGAGSWVSRVRGRKIGCVRVYSLVGWGIQELFSAALDLATPGRVCDTEGYGGMATRRHEKARKHFEPPRRQGAKKTIEQKQTEEAEASRCETSLIVFKVRRHFEPLRTRRSPRGKRERENGSWESGRGVGAERGGPGFGGWGRLMRGHWWGHSQRAIRGRLWVTRR